VLRIKLFCRGVQFFENFTLCDLDNSNVIIGNTFLDAYKINILHNRGKLKVHANNGYKLMNLDVDYNFALAKMGNLVVLTSELESLNFLIFISLEIS
jgi:hypothetical protein